MNQDTETIFLRKTNSPDDLGGYIEDNSLNKSGLGGYIVNISSDEAFFGGERYLSFYAKNVSSKTLKNLTITVNGGISDVNTRTTIEQVAEFDEAQRVDIFDNYTWADYYYQQSTGTSLSDVLQSRYLTGSAPYTNQVVKDVDSISSLGYDYNLYAWNSVNIYGNAYTRTSLLNQVEISVIPNPKRVAKVVESNGVGTDINLSNMSAYPGFIPSPVTELLREEEFWSFYLKIKYNFKPSEAYKSDIAFINFNWEDIEGYKQSQKVKLVFSTNYEDLTGYHKDIVARMYEFYPPFFGEYEE